MKKPSYRYFVGDFETTVFKGQTYTEVWASACVEMNTEDVVIHHSIGETFEYLVGLKSNVIIYYHNLKFDGSFWLSYLLTELKFKQAYNSLNEEGTNVEWQKQADMKNNTFSYLISDMGSWYNITIKVNNKYIKIVDSLKLLPFSVAQIGESFKTKHRKSAIEYTGIRYAGCPITEEEQGYIANDVLVVKEALEIMFSQGHNKLTIGSCCLEEFKHTWFKEEYESLFPDIYAYEIDRETYGYVSAGEYIRKSYRGGWCYLVKGKEDKVFYNGTTADVNSLYPSVMSSVSGNKYPTGKPTFWHGNFIPPIAEDGNHYYFVRIKTRFNIKPGYLPFIQAKHNPMYIGTENLETSDIYDSETGKYYSKYMWNGEVRDTRMTMTVTMTDLKLIQEHYNLEDYEIIDGCFFNAYSGLFDEYMEKYKRQKQTSKGALRQLAKLFLNNLYGKMASSTCSSFKVAFVKDDGSIGFFTVEAYDKKPGYIPIGSAITSYARDFTIRAAQKNYHGKDKPGFIYADTDSIHCDLAPEDIVGIKVDDTEYCCWKLESCWDYAYFTRQKTYIEHVTHENQIPVDKPYLEIKCAGMPEKCKDLFAKSLESTPEKVEEWSKETIRGTDIPKYTQEEIDFFSVRRSLTDFNVGLKVPGKLLPKRIKGGVLLTETTYEMR